MLALRVRPKGLAAAQAGAGVSHSFGGPRRRCVTRGRNKARKRKEEVFFRNQSWQP